MEEVLRESVANLDYQILSVPWPWNVPDGEWTYELFGQLPKDGGRYEIIEGRLVMRPSSEVKHQGVSANLLFRLLAWAKAGQRGKVYAAPLDLLLPGQNYLEPDLIFVAQDHQAILTEANIQGPPDLVVEILSPSTARADWKDKKGAYAAGGVAHYWVVDPDQRTLTAFFLREGRYALGSSFEAEATFAPGDFPGLEIKLGDIWE